MEWLSNKLVFNNAKGRCINICLKKFQRLQPKKLETVYSLTIYKPYSWKYEYEIFYNQPKLT